jgi:hypothetical protein
MKTAGQHPVNIRSISCHYDRSTSPVNNSPLKGERLSDAVTVATIGQNLIPSSRPQSRRAYRPARRQCGLGTLVIAAWEDMAS